MTGKCELIERVNKLLPRIADRAEFDDKKGEISDDTIQELIDAEVFSVLAPKSYGGHELSVVRTFGATRGVD